MDEYRTPGVYLEKVLSEPARVLRTGVPVFLGLVATEDLGSDLDRGGTGRGPFIAKPIPGYRGLIIRNRHYLSLPRRTISARADTTLSDRTSRDMTLHLRSEGQPERTPADRDIASSTGRTVRAAEPSAQPLSQETIRALSAKPQRFATWPQYERTFGSLKPYGFLANAVRGFFENGGTVCNVQVIGYDGDDLAGALEGGLSTLAAYDDYDLVCAPDLVWPTQLSEGGRDSHVLSLWQRMLVEHCAAAGNRMAILDAPRDASIGVMEAHRGRLQSPDAALYYPWLKVADGPQATDRYIPPCGHVAGVFARSDQHTGVHKAPANEVLEGVLGLDAQIDDEAQVRLNPLGVNCIRAFPRRGIRVWGARTLSDTPAWQYINVRRVVTTAVRWIDRNMIEVAFEPHSTQLWGRITRELTAYFTDLERRGALAAPADGPAFYVKCDAETNPPEIRETGHVVTEIGLRPPAPAEFIVIRVLHGLTGARIEGPELQIIEGNSQTAE